jgi:hypothetical protein
MDLPALPSLDAVRARLAATRRWADRLDNLKPGRKLRPALRQAGEDLDEAQRLLDQPDVGDKAHVLRAADTCIEVAQWRLRGIEHQMEDTD